MEFIYFHVIQGFDSVSFLGILFILIVLGIIGSLVLNGLAKVSHTSINFRQSLKASFLLAAAMFFVWFFVTIYNFNFAYNSSYELAVYIPVSLIVGAYLVKREAGISLNRSIRLSTIAQVITYIGGAILLTLSYAIF